MAVADHVKEARSQVETLLQVTAANLPTILRTGNEALVVAGAASRDAVPQSIADMLRERSRTDAGRHNDPAAKILWAFG